MSVMETGENESETETESESESETETEADADADADADAETEADADADAERRVLAPTPRCATHEGAQASGACERCGNFVCPLCLDEFSGLPDHCEACREREGGGLIAFEREEGNLLRRWWQTTKDVLFRPTTTFERSRPGSLSASMGFVALTGLGVAMVEALVGGIGIALLGGPGALGPDLAAELGEGSVWLLVLCVLVGYMISLPAAFIVLSFLRTCAYHGAVLLLGGDGGFRASLWSMNYLHATASTFLPLMVLRLIPGLGTLVSAVAMLAIEVFYALQLTTVARRYHHLPDGRASMAGWSMFMLTVMLGSLCCLAGAMAAF